MPQFLLEGWNLGATWKLFVDHPSKSACKIFIHSPFFPFSTCDSRQIIGSPGRYLTFEKPEEAHVAIQVLCSATIAGRQVDLVHWNPEDGHDLIGSMASLNFLIYPYIIIDFPIFFGDCFWQKNLGLRRWMDLRWMATLSGPTLAPPSACWEHFVGPGDHRWNGVRLFTAVIISNIYFQFFLALILR